MPYASNDDLPTSVRDRYTARCQTVYRDAWNADFERHGDEDRAFRIAETAAKNCADATGAKAAWSSSYITDLPDSAFACIDSAGRHYPHHDASGALDLPHLRAALSRVAQDATTSCGRSHLEDHAKEAGVGKSAPVMAVKFVGRDTVEGLAIPWGSPDSLDLDGEYFTPATDLCLDWFGKAGRPALYDHGMDDDLKSDTIGRQVDYEQRDEGLWAQVQLGRNARYRKAVDQLVAEGALGYSSGAMGHLATKNADGEITRWPWVEISLTPIPSHPGTLVHHVKSAALIEHLTAAGSDIPAPLVAAALRRLDDLEPDEWTLKAGRVLSAATRTRLDSHPTTLEGVAADLRELLDTADAPKEGAKATDIELELIRARQLYGVPV